MHRASFLLLAATISLVLCSTRQSAEAGPVTLGLEAYDALASVAPPAVEESSSSVVAQEEPVEVRLHAPVQDGLLPAGSMTGSSSATVSAGAVGGPAMPTPATEFEPSLAGLDTLPGDWIFIPPRFLDGVFRPPRMVVSL